MKKIGILGCGWLGKKIVQSLLKEDHELYISNTKVQPFTSKEQKLHSLVLDFSSSEIVDYSEKYTKEANEFSLCDIIIISIPTNRNHTIEEIKYKFQNICSFLRFNKSQQIFFFSSTSIYPTSDHIIQENSIENKFKQVNFTLSEHILSTAFPQINILRLAGLFGKERVFSKYFSNKILKTGNQPVNHIHYEDICQILKLLIDRSCKGKLYNIVAPQHPLKKDIINVQTQKQKIKAPTVVLNGPFDKKIISSEKLINELNYSFIRPDPTQY